MITNLTKINTNFSTFNKCFLAYFSIYIDEYIKDKCYNWKRRHLPTLMTTNIYFTHFLILDLLLQQVFH